MMEVLLYLYEHYLCREITVAGDAITKELVLAGFKQQEILRAYRWLDTLYAELEKYQALPQEFQQLTRILTPEEIYTLGDECYRFLLKLHCAGLLSTQARELLIDRAVALSSQQLSLKQFKWIALLVLCLVADSHVSIEALENFILNEDTKQTLH